MGSAISALNRIKVSYGTNHTWIVGVGAEYGVYLELGTVNMPPYPFLFPAAHDVMFSQFPRIEQEARVQPDAIGYIVSEVAKAIERQAKINATAGRSGRSLGTDADHPKVQTSNLRGSIEAYPAGAFAPKRRP